MLVNIESQNTIYIGFKCQIKLIKSIKYDIYFGINDAFTKTEKLFFSDSIMLLLNNYLN